jgi:hypothetical protein
LLASFKKRRGRASGIAVRRVQADVSDTAALDRLLEALPEAGGLRPRLTAPFFARAWDTVGLCDYWIVSDGTRVNCFIISGLTLQQAAGVRVHWDALRRQPTLSEDVLGDLIARQTGSSVTLVG